MQKWTTCSRNYKIPADFHFVNWHPLLLEGAFLWHTTGMEKTLTLNSEELEILSEMFGEIAALDFPISETPEFDALWDKIVS